MIERLSTFIDKWGLTLSVCILMGGMATGLYLDAKRGAAEEERQHQAIIKNRIESRAQTATELKYLECLVRRLSGADTPKSVFAFCKDAALRAGEQERRRNERALQQTGRLPARRQAQATGPSTDQTAAAVTTNPPPQDPPRNSPEPRPSPSRKPSPRPSHSPSPVFCVPQTDTCVESDLVPKDILPTLEPVRMQLAGEAVTSTPFSLLIGSGLVGLTVAVLAFYFTLLRQNHFRKSEMVHASHVLLIIVSYDSFVMAPVLDWHWLYTLALMTGAAGLVLIAAGLRIRIEKRGRRG